MRILLDVEAQIKELEAKRDATLGKPTEVYSRIVGYYRSIMNWNRGKRQEFDERLPFTVPRDHGDNQDHKSDQTE